MAVNQSEALVEVLCKRSSLSLWSYPNPIKAKGRELCDLIVVCDPDVIVFSVKEIALRSESKEHAERWRRKAIKKSCDQIYGAERWIRGAKEVIRADGSAGVPFPDSDRICVHRVAVAFGAERRIPFPQDDFGKGFVHVFEEGSLLTLMQELDTVSDFVRYLRDKEEFLSRVHIVLTGEEDLLGQYLHAGRSFPSDCDLMVIEEDIWTELTRKPEFVARKEEDRDSYVWDHLIEVVSCDILSGELEVGGEIGQDEQVLRIMARENRFSRRGLGYSFKGFLEKAATDGGAARRVIAQSGVGYVFLAFPHGVDREERREQLFLRTAVARSLQEGPVVIGIATEAPGPGSGSSFDLVFMELPVLDEEYREWVKGLQEDLKYWITCNETRREMDEFPIE